MRKSAKQQTKHCPYCGKTVSAAAVVCIYCDRDLFDLEAPEETEDALSSASAETVSGAAEGGSGGTAAIQNTSSAQSFTEEFSTVPRIDVDSEEFAAQAGEFAALEQMRAATRRKRVLAVVGVASVLVFGSAVLVARRDTTRLRNKLLPPPPAAAVQQRVALTSIPDVFAVQVVNALPVTDPAPPRKMPDGRMRVRLDNIRKTLGDEFEIPGYTLPADLRMMAADIRNETTVPLKDFAVTAEGYDKKGKVIGRVTHKADLVVAPGDSFSFGVPFKKASGDLPADATNPLASIGPVSAGLIIQGGAPLHPVSVIQPNILGKAVSGRIIEVTARPAATAPVNTGMPTLNAAPKKPAAAAPQRTAPKPQR